MRSLSLRPTRVSTVLGLVVSLLVVPAASAGAAPQELSGRRPGPFPQRFHVRGLRGDAHGTYQLRWKRCL